MHPYHEESLKQFTTCEKIYGHSIIYMNSKNNYYILSDILCNNTNYLLQKIISNKLEDISEINDNDINIFQCKLDKCQECDEQSMAKDLCLKCNKDNNYFPKMDPISESKFLIQTNYVECLNNLTKPKNFYFNKDRYEPCYEKCATCEYGGDGNIHNCTSCESNYIFIPDLKNTTNCVMKCPYYYYYKNDEKYSCTLNDKCPAKYNILIKEKKKCTDDCKKEENYKYYYNGECFSKCPNYTEENNDYNCKDKDLNKCLLNKKELNFLNETHEEIEVQNKVLEYIKDFNYADKHVTLYENEIYSILIYKNKECISYLNLTITEIDFNNCEEKVKTEYNIDEKLIVAIVSKTKNGIKYYSLISYDMFDPTNGDKLKADKICENKTIFLYRNLVDKLEEKNLNISSILYLTKQNIDIFDKSNAFYTDICYHCNLPINKDIPLKDRLSIYFPNITLCNSNCKTNGVNKTSLKAICECKYNAFKDKKFLEDSLLYQTGFVEITNILSSTNIDIIKCYKDIFILKYLISNEVNYIILAFILVQIIIIIIYYKKDLYTIRKFLFEITNKYISYLQVQYENPVLTNDFPIKEENYIINKNLPPKKNYLIKRLTGINILGNPKKSRKDKKKKGRKTISNNLYFNIKLFDNNLKLSDSNEINHNSKNLLISNSKLNPFDKSKNLKNIYANKQKIYEKDLNKNNETINIKANERAIIKSNLIINLKENLKINIREYLNTNPDDMDYEDAIKKDKRRFCDYFRDRLKTNQILLNTFYVNEPLRPRTIKFILLILNFDLYFLINGLFFNEEYISDVFHSNDSESFNDFVMRFSENCFYTTFVGVVINYIIDFFFVEEKKVKGILKREKNNLFVLNYEIVQLLRDIQKRYKYFIILSFAITSFTWYYVFCFNNIYPFTKVEWIKTSIMIIIIMQILSIVASLLESIIRYISFKCKSEKLYGMIQWLS